MRRIAIWGVLISASLAAAPAAASCRISASGGFSFDTRLSPQPGGVCKMTVEVFPGRSCGPTPRWQVLLPCEHTKQIAISDRGRLISILTPLAKRPELNVVRVTWRADRWAWVTLEKLAAGKPFKGPVRVTFEGDALRLKADRTELIPFETLRQLASALPD